MQETYRLDTRKGVQKVSLSSNFPTYYYLLFLPPRVQRRMRLQAAAEVKSHLSLPIPVEHLCFANHKAVSIKDLSRMQKLPINHCSTEKWRKSGVSAEKEELCHGPHCWLHYLFSNVIYRGSLSVKVCSGTAASPCNYEYSVKIYIDRNCLKLNPTLFLNFLAFLHYLDWKYFNRSSHSIGNNLKPF